MTMKSVSLRVAGTILALAYAQMVQGQQQKVDLETAPRLAPAPPVNFGTAQETVVTIGNWDFDPFETAQTYDIAGPLNFLRYSTGNNTGFIAGAQLPDGAALTSITFHLCDSSAIDQHWIGAVTICTSADTVCAILGSPMVSISNGVTPCVGYTQDLTPFNYVVNNETHRVALVAIPEANDVTNSFSGAVLRYKLQVSPAPAVATFGDVPTNHQFFQFIEALARSGITGGCGGGNFCPDNAVTRGQMAVFLAKALGLQFP